MRIKESQTVRKLRGGSHRPLTETEYQHPNKVTESLDVNGATSPAFFKHFDKNIKLSDRDKCYVSRRSGSISNKMTTI